MNWTFKIILNDDTKDEDANGFFNILAKVVAEVFEITGLTGIITMSKDNNNEASDT